MVCACKEQQCVMMTVHKGFSDFFSLNSIFRCCSYFPVFFTSRHSFVIGVVCMHQNEEAGGVLE